MIPADEPHPHLDFVVYRLRTAGWSTEHHFHAALGYILEWTEHGKQRCLWLKKIIEFYRLAEDGTAKKFTRLCSGDDSSGLAVQPAQAERDFWRMCLAELELGPEENTLAVFCQVIAAWRLQPAL